MSAAGKFWGAGRKSDPHNVNPYAGGRKPGGSRVPTPFNLPPRTSRGSGSPTAPPTGNPQVACEVVGTEVGFGMFARQGRCPELRAEEPISRVVLEEHGQPVPRGHRSRRRSAL